MTSSEDIKVIAQRVYDYLKQNCVGVQTTTSDAVEVAFKDERLVFSDDYLFDIDYELYRLISNERKYVMDSGEYRDCSIGLPYNCPFYFRPRWAKSPAWKIRIPYFNTGEEYLEWIKRIPKDYMPEPYERYFTGLYKATIHRGFEKSIPREKMIKALKRSQRTGEMIAIVPDKDSLPGGPGEGKCDGWTCHIEFLPMRVYFGQEYAYRKQNGEDLPPKEEWVEMLVSFPIDLDRGV